MGRGKKQIEGQLSFDFCLDTRNYVCQANALVGGKQALKLNSAKLIRSAIMQIVRDDNELKLYVITISEIAELLNIPASNVYRDIDDITNNILENPVQIKEGTGKNVKWIKIPWVTKCEYNSDVGVALKLNDELKPLLLNLKEQYTQYSLDCILMMKSVYAIRLYELLHSKIMTRVLPREGVDIELSLDTLKECLGCENKTYEILSNFKNRVIEVAVKEINEKTLFTLSYENVKEGRTVVALKFHMNMIYH